MNKDVVWEALVGGHRATVSFENGLTFRLTVLIAREGKWEWSTTPVLPGKFYQAGGASDADAAKRSAEAAIADIAEEARAWYQGQADAFHEVARVLGERHLKPPATPMPGPGVLVTKG